MKSSSSLFLLLLLSHLTPITRAESAVPLYQVCQNLGNYTTNSTYQSNLNLLLHTLSSNGPTTGFLTDTEGSSPNQVFGLALCRGDTIQSNCTSCLSNAVQDVVQLCPHQMSAIIWYDNCQLRYSNATFFSKVDSSLILYMWNVKNISDPVPFFASLNGAANDTRMFATGEMVVNGVTEMYVLVQCTRDLSPKSCEQCLQDAVGQIPSCCARKMGGRVIGASCNLRYEKYLFYGNSTLTAKPVVGGGDGGSPAPSPSYKGGDPALTPSKTTMATKGSKKNAPRPTLQIIIPVLILLIVTCITIAYFMKKKMVRNAQNQGDTHQITDTETIVFHLVTLRNATNDFSEENKLGEGGFGVVYKGTLQDGQEIAVKRLSKNSSQGIEELRNEVVLVAQLHHRNLVRLLGCCLEEEEKLLIYEFIPNTSLNNFLFNPTKGRELTWETRYKIIEGIARGLQYLHEDSQLKIIHRDLKASNILLDEKLIPKISDFGMARLFDMDQTQCNTNRVVGTYGYMAPEYAMYGLYSIKSDVFSFGVLCFEIITGRRNSHFCTSDDLLSHVWRYWTKGKVLEVVDPVLDDFSRNKVMQCIHIALLCVQEDAMIRPNMSSVVLMLSNYSASVRVPSRPAFSFGDSEPNQPMLIESQPMLIESQPMISAEDFTELEPR